MLKSSSRVFPSCVAALLGRSRFTAGAAGAARPERPGSRPPGRSRRAPHAKDPAGAPSSLVVLFDEGKQHACGRRTRRPLDRASRAYNEGKPIVMIVTGSSDRVGNPRMNLSLSQKRATAVLGRVAGPRASRPNGSRCSAKGETELPVPTKAGHARRPGTAASRSRGANDRADPAFRSLIGLVVDRDAPASPRGRRTPVRLVQQGRSVRPERLGGHDAGLSPGIAGPRMRGCPEAEFNVAVMLDSGRGVRPDLAEAAVWYAARRDAWQSSRGL